MFVFHAYGMRCRDAELPAITAYYDTQKNGELAEFSGSNTPVGQIVEIVDATGRQCRHIVVINAFVLGDAETPDEYLFVAFPI